MIARLDPSFVTLFFGLPKQDAVDQLLASGAEKAVLISLQEWKSHTAVDTWLWFDAQLEVFNSDK